MMISPKRSTLQDRLFHSFWTVSRILRETSGGRAGKRRILALLLRNGPVTQAELTEYLRIQPGSASEVLLKLENAGLIQRSKNNADRRTTDISLTGLGREEAIKAVEERTARKTDMLSALSSEEQEELLRLMEKLTADWENRFEPQPEKEK